MSKSLQDCWIVVHLLSFVCVVLVETLPFIMAPEHSVTSSDSWTCNKKEIHHHGSEIRHLLNVQKMEETAMNIGHLFKLFDCHLKHVHIYLYILSLSKHFLINL